MGEGDVRPALRQRQADGPADPHPAAGDERNLAGQGGGQWKKVQVGFISLTYCSFGHSRIAPFYATLIAARLINRAAASRHASSSAGLVQHRHPPGIQQDLAAHDDGVDVGAAGVVDQRRGRAVHRLAAHVVQIDEGDVGRRAGRQPSVPGLVAGRPTAAPRPSSSSGSHPPRPSHGRPPRRAWPATRRSWRTPADPASCSSLSRRCPARRRCPGRASSAPAPRRRPGTGCWSGQWTTVAPDCGDQVELGVGHVDGVDKLRVRSETAQIGQPLDVPLAAALRSSRSISSCVSATWMCVGRSHERARAVISRIASSQQRHGASGPDATRIAVMVLAVPGFVEPGELGQDAVERLAARTRGPPSRGQAPSAGRQFGRRWRPRRHSRGPAACDAARRS